ncbi:hypothetical protein [Pseudomonas frederiksbergensis]|uniref:hypothetical protein n=1 Tax=Pseudomonas frederiksbergensis TaxID=104087 RepID=UPI002855ACC5|nr:hypothetical protein [Pseudomonas frederiksbergensis]MDR7109235.1 hypothetical protein [Pseudomonas frederiksbergensis]
MSDVRAAAVGAFFGVGGVIVGALITGFVAVKVANMQLQQAEMTTRASSALTIRAALTEKATGFFAANEAFISSVNTKGATKDSFVPAAELLHIEASKLYPYLDSDLLVACSEMNADVAEVIKQAQAGGDLKLVLGNYDLSYRKFLRLYLNLRRELERSALVDVSLSQIDK